MASDKKISPDLMEVLRTEIVSVLQSSSSTILTMLLMNNNKTVDEQLSSIFMILLVPLLTNLLNKYLEWYSVWKTDGKFRLQLNSNVFGATCYDIPLDRAIGHITSNLDHINRRQKKNRYSETILARLDVLRGTRKCDIKYRCNEWRIRMDKKTRDILKDIVFKYDLPREYDQVFDLLQDREIYIDYLENKCYLYSDSEQYIDKFVDFLNEYVVIMDKLSNTIVRTPQEYILSQGLSNPIQIRTSYTLDDLILHEDCKVSDRIKRWDTKKEFHKAHHQPHKIALLLYGSPGVGKTSLAYAIATWLKYDVVFVKIEENYSLRNIHEDLKKMTRKVVLFDEIDRMIEIACSSSIGKNKKKQRKKKDGDDDAEETDSDGDTDNIYKLVNRRMDKKFMLELMRLLDDSYEDMVIIMTTNRDPGQFDEAFFRPGRIDHKEKMLKCSTLQFERLFESFTETTVAETLKKYGIKDFVFPHEKLSSAYIVKELLNPYHEEPDRIINMIKNMAFSGDDEEKNGKEWTPITPPAGEM